MFTIMSYNNTDSKFCTDTLINLGYKFRIGVSGYKETIVFNGMDTNQMVIDALTLARELKVEVLFINLNLECIKFNYDADHLLHMERIGTMRTCAASESKQALYSYKFDGIRFIIE